MSKKSKIQYSREAIMAFVILGVAYLVILAFLWGIGGFKETAFADDIDGDILKLTTTLPFVALYILVFIGATAGYARSAIVAKEMPFSKVLNQELKKKTMSSATIKTKIRSRATIKKDTPYLQAIDRLISARLPILAVVGDGKKVEGVITYYDIIKHLQSEIEKNPDNKLSTLSGIHVKDIIKEVPDVPVVAAESDSFEEVLNTMVKHQYNRLIVVENKSSNVYSGVVDIFDITSELIGPEEESEE